MDFNESTFSRDLDFNGQNLSSTIPSELVNQSSYTEYKGVSMSATDMLNEGIFATANRTPGLSEDVSRMTPATHVIHADALGVVLCIIILSLAILGRFLMVWQYHHCRMVLRKKLGRLGHKEKQYSATVLHTDQIEDTSAWVLAKFPSRLEPTGLLPLFLRGRNDVSMAGRPEVEILTDAMEKSKKVVFLVCK